MIECETLYGEKCLRSKADMRLRISAYAFVENDGKLLVVNTKSTGRFFVPGGEVDVLHKDTRQGINETLFDGLKRELKEETNVEIEIGEHFFFKEEFFNYKPINNSEIDETYYGFCHFYKCNPLSFVLSEEFQVEGDEAEKPQWVKMNDLNETNCQKLFWEVLQKYREVYGQ